MFDIQDASDNPVLHFEADLNKTFNAMTDQESLIPVESVRQALQEAA